MNNKFVVGDLVMFELSPISPGNLPRWVHNIDDGESGIWAKGRVSSVDSGRITVKYEIQNYLGTGECFFPNTDSLLYSEDQWTYPGYLVKVICECGSEKIFGKKSPHSHWCSKGSFWQDVKFLKDGDNMNYGV
jgi:hypothetical protein